MYKIKEINYNSNLYLNEDVIYYHKILYKGYLDRLNAVAEKHGIKVFTMKSLTDTNIEKE